MDQQPELVVTKPNPNQVDSVLDQTHNHISESPEEHEELHQEIQDQIKAIDGSKA